MFIVILLVRNSLVFVQEPSTGGASVWSCLQGGSEAWRLHTQVVSVPRVSLYGSL